MIPRRLFLKAMLAALISVALHQVAPDSARAASVGKRALKADKVLVIKKVSRLYLLRRGKVIRSYRVAFGFNPRGHKTTQGDGKTPEGHYVIDYRNRVSKFYRSLHVSYPNAADRAQARRRGVSPGGLIMIHGARNGMGWLGFLHTYWNWTEGCIAVTNSEIDEIWRMVANGTPIEIRP